MPIQKIDKYKERFLSETSGKIDRFYPTFGIKFDFFPRIIKGESVEPGLLNGRARDFFSARNDNLRIIKLDYMISLLKTFTITKPWYIKKITGLNNLMKINIENGRRLGKDATLDLEIDEDIDLKTLSFMDSYRSIVYDKKNMRHTLPTNLSRFDMKVYVTDIRNVLENAGSREGNLNVGEDVAGVVVYNLYDCNFEIQDFNFVNSINNEFDKTAIRHSIKIKVGRIYEQYNLPTERPFGVLGEGYASNDFDTDYNFLGNLFRINSLNEAELGNVYEIERNVNNTISDVRKIDNNPVITNDENLIREAKLNDDIYNQRLKRGWRTDRKKNIKNSLEDITVEIPKNETTISDIQTLVPKNEVSSITEQEVKSTKNESSIEQVNVEVKPNESKIENLKTLVPKNETEIKDTEVVSEENITNINDMQVQVPQNESQITNNSPTVPNNETTINQVNVSVPENTTSIAENKIIANENKTSISSESPTSYPNETLIDDVEISFLENTTDIPINKVQSNDNTTNIQRQMVEIGKNSPSNIEKVSVSYPENSITISSDKTSFSYNTIEKTRRLKEVK